MPHSRLGFHAYLKSFFSGTDSDAEQERKGLSSTKRESRLVEIIVLKSMTLNHEKQLPTRRSLANVRADKGGGDFH